MVPQQRLVASQRLTLTLEQFVAEHYHKTYSGDDGVLLGQLSRLVELGATPGPFDQRTWHQAIGQALNSH